MAAIDYNKLRNRTLDSSQEEEAVTVNTRALIDKVLARYSGEWTTLRELIQNAADASASKVTIKFETLPSSNIPLPQTTDQASLLKHTVLHHSLRRLVVTNDGQPFGANDWARLKKIAEGNPDETKIGAFGVGFYSVFSECENPLVMSGQDSMAFYWKGNSLFTRKSKLPPHMANNNTTFVLDYRSTSSPIPNLMSISQFLSQSLTFVGLECLELWLDECNAFTLTKKSAPSTPVPIPKDLETKSKQGVMKITGIESQNAQIDADWVNIVGWTPTTVEKVSHASDTKEKSSQGSSLRGFFSRLTATSHNTAAKRAAKEEEEAQQAITEDLAGKSRATVFLRVNTVAVRSSAASSFAAELERATKKPPPKATKIAILTSSYDETEASMSTLSGTAAKKVSEVLTSALPTKNGRIYIGFPTAQTTGLLAHISAPSLIPTVERENIDLNARHVRTWNEELLSIAGVACRVAYSSEMSSIRDKLSAHAKPNRGIIGDHELKAVLPAALHVFKQFNFQNSTPLPRAGELIEEWFWGCDKKFTIEIVSSRGVLPSHEVRIASENLSFVNGIPVMPEMLMKQAVEFMTKLLEFGLISEITTSDIRKELERQAISEAQLEEFLKWAAKKTSTESLDIASIQSLFSVTVANVESNGDERSQGRPLSLGEISSFINTSRTGPELPFPPQTIPFRLTKSLNNSELRSFGWEEMQLVPWLRWVIDGAHQKKPSLPLQYNPTSNSSFAGQVLATLSKGWEALSQSSKSTVIQLLEHETVVPTRLGLRKPSDAYFQSVRLFEDLPIVTSLSGVKEKFLRALGVRKTIELSVIFDRLMTAQESFETQQKPSWSHVDLVQYLVSVWNDIPAQDIVQLENTAMCPAEKNNNPAEATSQRYKLKDLFEPKNDIRSLGLPVLQWPKGYNPYSNEGKFLKLLGLRPHPTALELVQLMVAAYANMDISTYESALRYLVQEYFANGYQATDLSDLGTAFLPVEGREKGPLERPASCFAEPEAAVLGYHILRGDLRPNAVKYGVRTNPGISDCAIRLIKNPPRDRAEAKRFFGYLATRLQEITPTIADRLGNAAIVPIKVAPSTNNDKGVKYRLATPVSCFLGGGEEYGDIFDYVDFGHESNTFLLKVGSKHEPSTLELARNVVREPARIFQTIKAEKYLGLLRQLHLNRSTLKKDKTLWNDMKRRPFLLAYHEKTVDTKQPGPISYGSPDGEDDEEEATIKEWHLRSADQIVIVDDLICYSLFKNYLVAAPQEESIEEFYDSLGSPTISSQVREEPRLGPKLGDQSNAQRLRDLIIERSRLFLHEQPQSSIQHDVKWLEKKLEVQHIQSITLQRTLQGFNLSHSEKRTATLTAGDRGKAVLSVTSQYDLFQVSYEIVHLLIDRAKTQSVMILEMFLATSLLKLRSRGYNVDRILKRKTAEEARMVELQRQQKQEEEQARLERAEQSRAQTALPQSNGHELDIPKSQKGPGAMPGAFDETPPRPKMQDVTARQPPPLSSGGSGGLFSSLRERFGLEEGSRSSQQLHNLFGNNQKPGNNLGKTPKSLPPPAADPDNPPPYTPYDPNQFKTGSTTRGGIQKPGEAVTAPNNVTSNLHAAIRSSRTHNSSQLFSPPQTNTIKEVASYCDSHHAHNLTLVANSNPGLPIFVDVGALGSDPTVFIAENTAGLDAFAALLINIAGVFQLPVGSVHMFSDATGPTIAFNRSGSIFANYRYFAQLHQASFVGNPPATEHEALQARQNNRDDALVYWFVVVCHELAHNLVSDHSSDHSYYTEQFVVAYFQRVVWELGRLRGDHDAMDGRAT